MQFTIRHKKISNNAKKIRERDAIAQLVSISNHFRRVPKYADAYIADLL